MLELRLNVELRVRGPFTSIGMAIGGYGVDAVVLRDDRGCPVLPGSQVKGRLREALEEFDTVGAALGTHISEWLGPPVALETDAPQNGLRRHMWRISDFTAPDSFKPINARGKLITRIAIDRDTGTVKQGAMLVAETAAEPGELIPFTGRVDISADDSAALENALAWLYRAFCWIPSFGGFRGVGFGRMDDLCLTVDRLREWNATAGTAERLSAFLNKLTGASTVVCPPAERASLAACGGSSAECFHLELTLEEPFCVGGRREVANLFQSLDHIPGAVIKGAAAVQLRRVVGLGGRDDVVQKKNDPNWNKLCEHFGSVRFCAAFPAAKTAKDRPTVFPLSLAKVGHKDLGAGKKSPIFRDTSLVEAPFLFHDGTSVSAPAFAPDWKDEEKAHILEQFGWAKLKREVRLHTAIDPGQRRARDEHLFGIECILPAELAWRGTVDVHAVPKADRAAVLGQLRAFLAFATLRIGKTKAEAQATFGASVANSSIQPMDKKFYTITLQAPALLADPWELAKAWGCVGKDPLATAYAEFWSNVSDDALTLVRFFADQDLLGGFLGIRDRSQPYNPLFVTSAGSVFVLEVVDAVKAAASINAWSQCGLSLPTWASKRYGSHFARNPMLPADGFGEIAINLAHTVAPRPKAAEMEALSNE